MESGSFIKEYLFNPAEPLGAVAIGLLILVAAWLTSFLLGRVLSRGEWVVGRLGRKVDPTVVRYTLRIKTLTVFILAGLLYVGIIPGLRGVFGTLLASAGLTALVFGFAAKSTLSNLISGLALAVYRPIRIGDRVKIEDVYGIVEDITLRHTIIRTWKGERLILPNEKIDNMTLTNYSIIDAQQVCTIEIGVSYDTDLDMARRIILEVADECPHIQKHPKEPWVRVVGHKDFAIALRLYAWVADKDEDYQAQWWVLEQVKKRFDDQGVEIPFPYRTVVYKKDLPPPVRDQGGEGK